MGRPTGARSPGRTEGPTAVPPTRRPTPPRGSPALPSASSLPAGDAEAQGEQGDGREAEEDRELVTEQLRRAGCGKAADADKGHPGAAEDQRDAGKRGGQVAAPGGREDADRRQACGDEEDRDQARAQRVRSRARQTAVAPTRLTRTTAAMASVANASCTNSSRPTSEAPKASVKVLACANPPRNAEYASTARSAPAPTAPSCRHACPMTVSMERYRGPVGAGRSEEHTSE